MPTDLAIELVTLIRSNKGMADRLLHKHLDDGTGHCRTCHGGAQSGHYRFPCIFLVAAAEAKRRGAL